MNEPTARLLGKPSDELEGQPCFEALDGCDTFGNRYCVPGCPMIRMRRSLVPVRPFQLAITTRDGRRWMWFVPLSLGEPAPDASHAYALLETPPHEGASGQQPRPPVVEPSAAGTRAANGRYRPSSRPPPRSSRPPAPAKADVTRREREVLRLLAEGAETEVMATRLGISTSTVRNHVQSILRKLEAHSRLEAVAIARRMRLL